MSSRTDVASDGALTKEAYARVKTDWASLPSDELLQVNLDLQYATATVLGAWCKLQNFRQAMQALPGFDITQFDKLEDYVLALRHVHSRYPNNLDELVEAANLLCDMLEADARALALRGLFDPAKLAALHGGNSYKSLADDLDALANEFEVVFPDVRGKCATTPADLTAATQMATRLTRLVGNQHLSPATVAALSEERERAFTQLIKAYDETRAAIAFLRRREEDLEALAPNLYAGNTRRRKREARLTLAARPSPTSPGRTSSEASASSAVSGQMPPTGAKPSPSSPFVS